MFNSVDFPAPLGPIIAVNSPDLNSPETPFNTDFCSERQMKREKCQLTTIEWNKRKDEIIINKFSCILIIIAVSLRHGRSLRRINSC